MNIDVLIALLVGIMLSANFGVLLAGMLAAGGEDEDMPDQ